MSVASLYGLIAWALIAGAAASFAPVAHRRTLAWVVVALALVPAFAGESFAMALHGAGAAPSFTLAQLAAWRLAAPQRPSPLTPTAAMALAALALVFYPLALGLGPLDPYGFGYRPWPLLLALLPVAGGLAWRRQDAWLLLLGMDLLAYAGGLFGNFWDALIDPALVVAGLAVLAARRRP